MIRIRRYGLPLTLLLSTLLIVAVIGCGSNAKAEVEKAQRDIYDAWNRQDIDGVLNRYTDKGLIAHFGAPREQVREFLPGVLSGVPVALRQISDVQVSGAARRQSGKWRTYAAAHRAMLLRHP